MDSFKEEINKEQSKPRIMRGEHTVACASFTEKFDPNKTDELINDMLKKKAEISEKYKDVFHYALVPIPFKSYITKWAEDRKDIPEWVSKFGWKSLYGITIVELEGLKENMLCFKSAEAMQEFLDVVESNKTLMFQSQERAVEEAIKFYEFLGKMKNKDIKEEKV